MDESSSPLAAHRRRRAVRATILVVDAEDAARSELCRVLACAGYAVIPARGQIEAAWFLARERPADLLVSDVSMIERDGYHFGLPLVQLQRRVPVLFMAAWSHDETVRRGVLHPRAPFLRKPCPPYLLTRTVGRLLRARRELPPA
jgi:two-component system cell cycle sensor histidine kinase/response regulator CckA